MQYSLAMIETRFLILGGNLNKAELSQFATPMFSLLRGQEGLLLEPDGCPKNFSWRSV
jgi:hypothetical protein